MTEWRDIPGYEGWYQVSANGQVRSLDRIVIHRFKDGRIRKANHRGCILVGSRAHSGGYPLVHLHRDGRRVGEVVHRLVLKAFVGPAPQAGMEGCHRDGDPMNNDISNLYWGTRKENVQDMARHGTAAWMTRTQCPNGHLYVPATTAGRKGVNGPGTVRKCRICNDAAQKRYYTRKREQARNAVAAS